MTVGDGRNAGREERFEPGVVGEPFDVAQVGDGGGDRGVQRGGAVRGDVQVVRVGQARRRRRKPV